MRITAIITGGGLGQRFGDDTPKQFHTLPRRSSNQPIIVWTARQFEQSPEITDIVLCVPHAYIAQMKRYIRKVRFRKVIAVVAGGETRRDSVRNALWSIAQKPPDAVLIHDAVRPFVDDELITRVVERLSRAKIVVPAVEPSDTVRRRGKRRELGRLEDRNNLLMIQTPQAFKWKVLTTILPKWNLNKTATDDASIAIENGISVSYVEGSHFNFKITSRDDLQLARSLAKTWTGKRQPR
jgi:2-C-methyl-D-erythritol 4-phosphate cytidylyltransferase